YALRIASAPVNFDELVSCRRVGVARNLQAVVGLERCECTTRARAEPAIDGADVVPEVSESSLNASELGHRIERGDADASTPLAAPSSRLRPATGRSTRRTAAPSLATSRVPAPCWAPQAS